MNIELEKILRYGASGGFGVVIFLLSFFVQNKTVMRLPSWAPSEWALVILSILAGTLIYATYRSLLFPMIYRLTASLAGRKETLEELDISRWQRMKIGTSLQPMMVEWAAQIHLLLTSSVSGASFLTLGIVLCFEKTMIFNISCWIVLLLGVAGVWSLYKYQRRESQIA